jgi:hypothetical protein
VPSTTALDRERLQWTNTEIVNKHELLLRTQLFKAAVGKGKETNLQKRKKETRKEDMKEVSGRKRNRKFKEERRQDIMKTEKE